MSRVGTALLNLGMWLDGENPGAGSQSVANTGLNGDKMKIDIALGTGHNPDGSHMADVIDGPSIKTTAVDGSSLQATGSPRKISVKTLGIQNGHINSNVADGDSLVKDGTSGQLKINVIKAGKLLGTGTGKAVDNASIDLNGSNELEVKDVGITAAKIAHDNKRTKILLAFSIDPTTGYGVVGSLVTTAALGLVMPRAGSITAITAIRADGTAFVTTMAYGTDGVFSANAKITVSDDLSGNVCGRYNGYYTAGGCACGSIAKLVVLEIEFAN